MDDYVQCGSSRPTGMTPPPPPEFTLDPNPEDRHGYRMWRPSPSSYGNNLFLHSGNGRREWQAAIQSRVVDNVGYYKCDHGHKNNDKVMSVPGCKASIGTFTLMTSTMKVAAQVDVHNTSVDAVAPVFQEIHDRCKKRGAPVSFATLSLPFLP
jgi:hypothetical protein